MLSVLIILIVENNHQKSGIYTIISRPENIFYSLSKLFKKKQPWFIAIFSASVYFVIEYLSENEGRSFLVLKKIK